MTRNKKISYLLTYLLCNFLYVLLIFLMQKGIISRYQRGILNLICINIILAISLNITVGVLGQITLGHAGFMSIGAYTAGLLAKNVFHSASLYQYLITLLIAGILALFVGILVGIPALRLKGDYLAIITLAFGEIIRVFIEYFRFTGGSQGLSSIPTYQNFTTIFIIMVTCVIFMYTCMTSRYGRAVMAIREDEIASESCGINTTFYKTLAFSISAFFAGIAGAIFAQNISVITAKQFDFNYSINILVMVVLGGMGSFTGAILSAIVLTILPEALRGFQDYRTILYSLILILMMLFRPSGLLGRKEFQISKVVEFFSKKKEGK